MGNASPRLLVSYEGDLGFCEVQCFASISLCTGDTKSALQVVEMLIGVIPVLEKKCTCACCTAHNSVLSST